MAESYSFGYWGATSEEILKNQFPLHKACRDGDVEELSRLLVVAQNGIYEEDSFYGWTPAHWAAYFGKLNCLMRLLESGVNSDASTLRLNQTALHISAFAGNSHCLKWLMHCGAAVDRQDYLGETCVHKAARTGSMECVSLLTSHGARLFIRNNNGCLPAEVAMMCGYEECAKYLNAATERQESQLSEAKGVYQAGPTKHATTTPSPHDITVPQKVEPCVILQGLNGGRLPPPAPPGPGGDCTAADMSTDCDMETESQDSGAAHVSVQSGSDVTLSSKDVVVAGRKRAREDTDDMEHKRIRTSDYRAERSSFGGFTTFELPTSHNVSVNMNGFSAVQRTDDLVDMEQPDDVDEAPVIESTTADFNDENDYLVGYDYCGIPQYPDGSFTPTSSNNQSQDDKMQNTYRCSIGGLSGHMI